MKLKISSDLCASDNERVTVIFKDGSRLDNVPLKDGFIETSIPYTTEIIEITASMPKVGIKMRIKPPKRRTPLDRLKARLYYRRNRSKIKLQRKKYMRKHKSLLKHRKQLFQRYKPTWVRKPPKHTAPKPPKIKAIKPPRRP